MKYISFLLTSLIMSSPLYAQDFQANTVNLDKLFEVSKNNFCYQQNNTNYQGIEGFFHINENSKLYLLGKPVSMSLSPPIITINDTGDHLKEIFYKNSQTKKTPTFTQYQFANVNLKNIYTLEFSSTIEVTQPPYQLISQLAKKFPGINMNPDSYSGQFILYKQLQPNFDSAKDLNEINKMMDNLDASSYAFSLSKLENGNTLLNYKCQIVIVTDQTAEQVARQIAPK